MPLKLQVSLQGLVILHLSLVETFPIRHPAVDTLSLSYSCHRLWFCKDVTQLCLMCKKHSFGHYPHYKSGPLHIVCYRYNAHRWARNKPTWTCFNNVPPLFREGDALVVLDSESDGRLMLMLRTWFQFHTRCLCALDCWACSIKEKKKGQCDLDACSTEFYRS